MSKFNVNKVLTEGFLQKVYNQYNSVSSAYFYLTGYMKALYDLEKISLSQLDNIFSLNEKLYVERSINKNG